MFPFLATAASFLPSLDDAICVQPCVLPTDVSSVQVSPESVDVQMVPSQTVAASLVPSFDDVINVHVCVLALDVHVSPGSPVPCRAGRGLRVWHLRAARWLDAPCTPAEARAGRIAAGRRAAAYLRNGASRAWAARRRSACIPSVRPARQRCRWIAPCDGTGSSPSSLSSTSRGRTSRAGGRGRHKRRSRRSHSQGLDRTCSSWRRWTWSPFRGHRSGSISCCTPRSCLARSTCVR